MLDAKTKSMKFSTIKCAWIYLSCLLTTGCGTIATIDDTAFPSYSLSITQTQSGKNILLLLDQPLELTKGNDNNRETLNFIVRVEASRACNTEWKGLTQEIIRVSARPYPRTPAKLVSVAALAPC